MKAALDDTRFMQILINDDALLTIPGTENLTNRNASPVLPVNPNPDTQVTLPAPKAKRKVAAKAQAVAVAGAGEPQVHQPEPSKNPVLGDLQKRINDLNAFVLQLGSLDYGAAEWGSLCVACCLQGMCGVACPAYFDLAQDHSQPRKLHEAFQGCA